MLCTILKDFKGSQDGRLTEFFAAGTVRDLSQDLAVVAIKEGWAKKASQPDLAPAIESPTAPAGAADEPPRKARGKR